MKNDENWESEIDWSKRTTVVGGTAFYEFVKDKAIPVLDDGIRQLEAAKARCEDKMRRWGAIAERAVFYSPVPSDIIARFLSFCPTQFFSKYNQKGRCYPRSITASCDPLGGHVGSPEIERKT